ncbi:pre-rRNA processing and 40S ribosomal subunit assembly [Talaromyces marneffei ATCC 18224]|uniref:Protein FAF1 n=1 Tax=Talaromyces marneffei (strain ATCC 18224 / CBS 334.59 / QM 7333) TaxID=441960 RepID=B6QGA5_TALMQ|nr:uncharacterized protein EYB26_004537 [Talaromyces marneffei]EEA24490.1 conserved hypothetical protein [Talaromyces marneffei ATCC 18224]KAE8553002.1 hypothetical protein EYB25_004381 [Talaromyces marneffei]QGA16867.1 hypothetical protein EYB26_004537 [Talaromyces marneffei]
MRDAVVKRRKISSSSTAPKNANSEAEADNSNELLRKFFESRFQPLDIPTNPTTTDQISDEDEEGDESRDDFEGFSDNESESDGEVMVVEHVDARKEDVMLDKQTRKALLSAKIPASTKPSTTANKQENKSKGEAAENETENLQNDLALQRLLKESHLLESGSSDLNPTGKNRHKALDLRLQALGAKTSIFAPNKMPKSHREGIQSKAIKTETTRRREARENGIILEKPVFKQKKSSIKRRERGVGAPAVGKFSGGTLRLSKQDLASIQGPSRKGRKGGKGGKGSKRGRR